MVDRNLQRFERQTAFENAHALPRITLSQRNVSDLECIATGVYNSPLEGFVAEEAPSGVKAMYAEGEVYFGGPITSVNTIPYSDFLMTAMNRSKAHSHIA